MTKKNVSRRTFMKGAALTAAGVSIVPRHVLGGVGYQAPSDTLNVAAIGAGGMGGSNLENVQSENVVALADVDWDRASESFERFPEAARYKDFRRMMDEHGDDIDAVIIATPDHTHAVAASAVMQMGKHVYVQKPLTRTIREARRLLELADQYNVVTQMGNQGHSHDDGRRLLELVWAGAIGAVEEVHIWTNRPIWPQAVPRPTNSMRVPSDLDWDLWLGPAPDVPYHEAYAPFAWRGWVDWGTSALGDMGAHLIDHAYWALGLDYPTSVWTSSSPFGGEDERATYPQSQMTQYKFGRGGREPITMMWYDGGLIAPRPDALPDYVDLSPGGGALMVGEKGVLLYDTYGHNPRLFPEHLEEEYASVPQTVERIDVSHEMNWVNACKGLNEPSCPFSYAVPLTETMLLGVVSLQAGELIYYDPKSMTIPNAPGAEEYLHYDYRGSWEI
ncbi:MAG: Gfo/Idh/MocA family oxidoreductase [Rhodothermales bacterium]